MSSGAPGVSFEAEDGIAYAPGTVFVPGRWYISARNNATLLTVDIGIENSFESLQLIKKMNDVGTWALQLRKESAHLSTFLPVDVNGKKGFPNGILVWLDNQDGNGPQLVMSGPQTDIDLRSQQDNTQPALITGCCDNYWLKKRLALPVPDYPYAGYIGAYFVAGGAPPYHYVAPFPLRYYQLNEASGTTATDTMTNANGTYNGTVTYSQPGLIDDPSTCIKFDGATTFVSVPTTGMPTGNSAFTVCAWAMFASNPSGNAIIWAHGSTTSGSLFWMGVNSSGQPVCSIGPIIGAASLALNTPHLFAATWDGTTLSFSVDGVLIGTATPGTQNFTYTGGGARIGCSTDGTSKWAGWGGHCAFYTSAIAVATIATIYAVGVSRQAYLAYDTRPTPAAPGKASTAIYQYVDVNAGSSALPSSTFTNWQGTHYARQIPHISLAADPLIGSTLTGLARMDKLLYLIAALALQSNPELFFKLEQSGSHLLFTILQPEDLTSIAVFSRQRSGIGNILDYEWKVSGATANYIYAGGSNPSGGSLNLTDRLFGENADADSISANGYLEDFLDYRQGLDGTTLQQAISGQLAQDASIVNINATLFDQAGLSFKGPTGKGYDLGKIVRVIVDGYVFDEIIRQIEIDLQPGQPVRIMPAIGTPVAAEIMSEFDTIAQRLQSLQSQSNILAANY